MFAIALQIDAFQHIAISILEAGRFLLKAGQSIVEIAGEDESFFDEPLDRGIAPGFIALGDARPNFDRPYQRLVDHKRNVVLKRVAQWRAADVEENRLQQL